MGVGGGLEWGYHFVEVVVVVVVVVVKAKVVVVVMVVVSRLKNTPSYKRKGDSDQAAYPKVLLSSRSHRHGEAT